MGIATEEAPVTMAPASKLLPCPQCGSQPDICGPEDWSPTFSDPDGGGPVVLTCKCGVSFSIGSQDYQETFAAWNEGV